MRRFIKGIFLSIGLALGLGSAGLAGEGLPRDPGIEAVISGQMEAFRADDMGLAFSFASPGIQGMFGSAERFGAMVRQGYPMVHRPGELRFLELREEGGRLRQKIMLRDADGALHLLEYSMIEVGGGWQIDGVELLQAGGVGA